MNPEDIQNIFFVECEEALQSAEAGLAACQTGSHDSDTINEIFRAVHSIKGGAGAFGYAPLQTFTHQFEALLSEIRDGIVEIDEELVNMMLRALDVLSDHVAAARAGEPQPDDTALLSELVDAQLAANKEEPAHLAGDDSAPASPSQNESIEAADLDLDALLDELTDAPSQTSEARWLVHIRPHDGAMTNGSEPLLLLRELVELGGECERCDVSALPQLDQIDLRQGYLGWTISMPGEVTKDEVVEIFDFIDDDCSIAFGGDEEIPPVRERENVGETDESEAAASLAATERPPSPRSVGAPVAQSIRIDISKLDQLIDGVGELVIAQAMLARRLEAEGQSKIEELAGLEGLIRDIQEKAMAFRAQPVGTVFARMPRLLRELAASTGKHVKLKVSGESAELDKSVIERLSEPLTHLVRNAVDHGIEDSDARIAAGKPAEGTLSISAEQRAGRIVVRISDDGRGIDRKKVLAKAVEAGLVTSDASLSGEEVDHLIFAPGFSTADQVSSISGRGVGMDVVRENVTKLGGRIWIESEAGKGTTVALALPLTLAIADGMMVVVGNQTLVVPLTHVVESLQPEKANLKGMGAANKMLNVRGQFIPIVPLHEVLGCEAKTTDPCDGVLVIVDTEHSGQTALLVDAIADQRQFVVKSLDRHFSRVDGIAGATIMGDGSVALILDVDGLVPQSELRALGKIAA